MIHKSRVDLPLQTVRAGSGGEGYDSRYSRGSCGDRSTIEFAQSHRTQRLMLVWLARNSLVRRKSQLPTDSQPISLASRGAK